FDDEPRRIAGEILRNGTYGIITVGYGPQVTDKAALQAISGGAACSFTADDTTGLLNQVNSVKLLILEGDANGGKYCGMLPPTTTVEPGTTIELTTTVTATTITIEETTTTETKSPVTTTFPTLEPTMTTTPSEVLRFDILFLVDVSKEAKDRLDDMNNFVKTVMSAYDVSLQSVRVGLIAVGSGETGPTTVASFRSIQTYEGLLEYLKAMRGHADFKHDGQAIEEALTTAVLKNFMNAGYRTSLKNHLIVYVTATTKFDDEPRRIAGEILTNGTYGIITVGYGPQVTDKAALQAISGGAACSFTANDITGLMNQVNSVKLLILEAE
ncbi:von Willebrand factor type A domain protein, partial [Teladorsagia circumcincta]